MQKRVVQFFLQHQQVILPDLGKLKLQYQEPNYDFGAQSLSTPKPFIHFELKNYSSTDLISFVSKSENISQQEAENKIKDFVTEIKSLKANSKILLPALGFFSVNDIGEIIFSTEEIESDFLPNVKAQKVIHPTDTHEILVGDTHTNTAAMVEYFSADNSSKKMAWWVWAIIFAVIGVAVLFFSLYNQNAHNFFGNAQTISNHIVDSTYQFIQP
jgi:hypothetical protein